MSHTDNPLLGNADAAAARVHLQHSQAAGSSTDRRLAAAQQATASALLAVAHEIRRAGTATALLQNPLATDAQQVCGVEHLDEFGYVDTCDQPRGHDGEHARAGS